MGPSEWIAFGGLVFLIASGGATVVWKLSANKGEIIDRIAITKTAVDAELEAMRIAAFVEYKELRQEMKAGVENSYRHFGEAPAALREKVNQIELFMRDNFVLKTEYEKDHERLLDVIRDLQRAMEKRFDHFEESLKDMRNA